MTETNDTLSSDDRLEIIQLIALHNVAEDTGDAVAFSELYTKDGTSTNTAGIATSGRDNLFEKARKRWAENPKYHSWVHWASNVIVTPTPEGAEVDAYGMVLDKSADSIAIRGVSTVHAVVRHEDGKWRFFSHQVRH